MELAFPSISSLLSPPGALPLVREPNRRWARGAVRPSLLRLRVAEVVVETPGTKSFVFDAALDYLAGQHLTVVAEIGGRTERRCYSFSSSPLAGGRPAITVKRVDGGLMSSWLHDSVRPGDVLRVLPPSGSFTLPEGDKAAGHLVLVAGGVGITPLISIAETILLKEQSTRVTLLYGSRSEDEVIFRARLEALAQTYAHRFELVLAADDAGDGWKGLSGAMTGERVVGLTRGLTAASWFVCGPQPMMDSVSAALRDTGVESAHIHLERFEYAEAAAARIPDAPGTLVFAKSGTTTTAAAGTTLLDAAEKAGVALPSSCRMGGCGACKIKVDGRVVAAEPNCLSEAEKSQGYALACCSWPDGRVVIQDY